MIIFGRNVDYNEVYLQRIESCFVTTHPPPHRSVRRGPFGWRQADYSPDRPWTGDAYPPRACRR